MALDAIKNFQFTYFQFQSELFYDEILLWIHSAQYNIISGIYAFILHKTFPLSAMQGLCVIIVVA